MDFNLEESIIQLIRKISRTNLRGGVVESSAIDHVSTNCPTKCSEPTILEELGNSDHFGISVNINHKQLEREHINSSMKMILSEILNLLTL